jgi:hypothetical protein
MLLPVTLEDLTLEDLTLEDLAGSSGTFPMRAAEAHDTGIAEAAEGGSASRAHK